MNQYHIKCSAVLMVRKYGLKSLLKAVSAVKFYLNSNDDEEADRWVAMGYEIKNKQRSSVEA